MSDRNAGSTRYHVGESVYGMSIVKVILRSSSYKNDIYKVQFACGHVERITGNALILRRWKLGRGLGTNLCSECAHEHGIENTRATCQAAAAARRGGMKQEEGLMMFGGGRAANV